MNRPFASQAPTVSFREAGFIQTYLARVPGVSCVPGNAFSRNIATNQNVYGYAERPISVATLKQHQLSLPPGPPPDVSMGIDILIACEFVLPARAF